MIWEGWEWGCSTCTLHGSHCKRKSIHDTRLQKLWYMHLLKTNMVCWMPSFTQGGPDSCIQLRWLWVSLEHTWLVGHTWHEHSVLSMVWEELWQWHNSWNAWSMADSREAHYQIMHLQGQWKRHDLAWLEAWLQLSSWMSGNCRSFGTDQGPSCECAREVCAITSWALHHMHQNQDSDHLPCYRFGSGWRGQHFFGTIEGSCDFAWVVYAQSPVSLTLALSKMNCCGEVWWDCMIVSECNIDIILIIMPQEHTIDWGRFPMSATHSAALMLI